MTSIKKDLRELAKNWTSCYSGEDCAVELESLIPRIVAAVEKTYQSGRELGHSEARCALFSVDEVETKVEQAQAEAIQSAVDVCVKANQARGYAIAVAVAALTPRLVQLNAELQMKRSKLEGRREEAAFQLGAFHPRVSELERQITNLRDIERELEAERKQPEEDCTHTHLFRGYCPKCTANRKEAANE